MTTTEQISQKPTEGQPAVTIRTGRKPAYRVMVAAALVLAATGIGTFVLGKAPMTQWVLMAHVTAAPLFAVGLALVALTWAEHCRFGALGSRQSGLGKALLWLILACGVVVILSGVVPM